MPTIRDLLAKSAGDIEIIATFDGYWPSDLNPPQEVVEDPRVRYIHRGQARGMRAGINAGAAIAKGEYLAKFDGHCMFSEGWDIELVENTDVDWVVVPKRKRLDPEEWCITEQNKPDICYQFLSYPDDPNDWGGKGLNGKNWEEKNRDKSLDAIEVDDLMSAQGSGWFMPKRYYEHLELMDESQYGMFWNEFQEIGLKTWLSGGQVKVNKRCWYAHLHKGKKYGRGYRLTESSLQHGASWTMKWMNEPVGEAWHKANRPLTWLIEHFWPVPSWPEDRSKWEPGVVVR